jgi:tetratricopeptide (TPR) repeat protein
MVRERLEDAQVRRGRHQLAVAEQRAKNEKTQDAVDLYKRMKGEFNNVELGVFRSRAERYPANLGLKFELGVRLKRARQFKEAIEALQAARGEPKRKAAVHLELGECFEYIKQPKLALPNYEAAIEATSERDADQLKLAYYRAGALAYAMRELDGQYLEKAEKYLTHLAGLDYGYKDVAARLDKLRNG